IKSKVRQNNIEGAVSDYNSIYMNNMNTAKGTHALLNMEILSAGSGDNLSGGNEIENFVLKQNRINDIISSVINKKSDNLSIINKQPDKFHLSQNYPNPFNPITKIAYSIPVSGIVTIKIFDITGREIKTLVNEFRNAGSYEIEFDGGGLSSGVYYYKLETNNFSETRKMILIK
ncbi:MAG TPA: T9SS type A sorting domain-containing protein, partial [Ignavibacteria bacterium]|nr:T9SS type A sorting domain-containing protein [Ignavibacteria bacterium]